MQKTKAKRGLSWQMLPFVIIWAISIFIGGQLSAGLMRMFIYPFLTPEAGGIASNVMPVLITGVIQVFLVERLLKQSMRGWMLFTAVSGLVTLFLIHVVAKSMIYSRNPYFSHDLYMLVNVIAYYVPAPVLQYFWLRRRVNQPWLWPVTGVLLMGMVFLRGFLARDYSTEFLESTARFLSYSVIQASIMYTLWSSPRDTQKAKLDHAIDDQANQQHERIERLQDSEREHRNPLWDTGDEQALQSEV